MAGLVLSFCSVSVFTLEGSQYDTVTILCMILAMLQLGVVPSFTQLSLIIIDFYTL